MITGSLGTTFRIASAISYDIIRSRQQPTYMFTEASLYILTSLIIWLGA